MVNQRRDEKIDKKCDTGVKNEKSRQIPKSDKNWL